MTYRVLTESSFIDEVGIKQIEETRHAKYVYENCQRTKDGGYANFPLAVFYTEKKHPEGSHFFGVFVDPTTRRTMVCDAAKHMGPINGIALPSGDVIYSRYRHDFREHQDVFVDGGRDYLRCGGKDLAVLRHVTIDVTPEGEITVTESRT